MNKKVFKLLIRSKVCFDRFMKKWEIEKSGEIYYRAFCHGGPEIIYLKNGKVSGSFRVKFLPEFMKRDVSVNISVLRNGIIVLKYPSLQN